MNPPPNNYDIKSLFKINKEKSKGKTFGLSREVCWLFLILKLISQCLQRVIELLQKDTPVQESININQDLTTFLILWGRKLSTHVFYFNFIVKFKDNYTSAKKVPGPGQY